MINFNILDLVFISLGLIFVIIAFFRGFIREVFSLVNWVISVTIASLLSPLVAKLLSHYLSNKLMVDLGSKILIFVLAFIIVGISTSKLSLAMKKSLPSSIDQSLGILYGLFKTLLIFGVVYSVINNFYMGTISSAVKKSANFSQNDYLPKWLTSAKSYKIIKSSGELIDPLIKNMINSSIKNVEIELNTSNSKAINLNQTTKSSPKSEASDSSDNSNIGYTKKEIEKMDRLIDVIAK